jgi:hypothetical protein
MSFQCAYFLASFGKQKQGFSVMNQTWNIFTTQPSAEGPLTTGLLLCPDCCPASPPTFPCHPMFGSVRLSDPARRGSAISICGLRGSAPLGRLTESAGLSTQPTGSSGGLVDLSSLEGVTAASATWEGLVGCLVLVLGNSSAAGAVLSPPPDGPSCDFEGHPRPHFPCHLSGHFSVE